MRITESKIRQIIREEARRVLREGMDDFGGVEDHGDPFTGDDEMDDKASGGAHTLKEIGRLCETELMNKSLVMKGVSIRFMERIVELLNEMMGEHRVDLIIEKRLVPPPHHDAVEALEWISVFCKGMGVVRADDLAFRSMCLRQITGALGGIPPYKVKVDTAGLPGPDRDHPLGADIDDEGGSPPWRS